MKMPVYNGISSANILFVMHGIIKYVQVHKKLEIENDLEK